MDILKGIFLILIGYCIKWLENYLRNRNPISIDIDPKLNSRGSGGSMGKKGCEMLLSLDVNLSNNTGRKIGVKIKNVDLSPAKEIVFFKFKYRKGLHKTGFSFLHQKVDLVAGDNLFRFPFEMTCVKSFNSKDFESCKSIPMVFKIEYSVSPKFKEKKFELPINNFFEELEKLITRKGRPNWK